MAADGAMVAGPAPIGPVDVLLSEADRARDVERFVLGALLLDPSAIPTALDEGLAPEDFGDHGLALVFRAMLRCDASGAGCDPPALLDAMLALGGARSPFDRSWCADALRTLGDDLPTTAYLREHARAVRRWARVRRILAELRRAQTSCPDASREAEAWAERVASGVLAAAAPDGATGRVLLGAAVGELVDAVLTSRGAPVARGLPLPWGQASRLTGGLGPGQLVLLAARPKVGKSAAALQIALGAAEHGAVLFVSLEMTRAELAARAVSILGAVDGDVASGRIAPRPEDEADLMRAVQLAERLPLEIVDAPSQTVTQIRARARQVAARERLALVVVDYVQLVAPESSRRDETREREVATIARSLKALAMELQCPVLALSQLSRAADGVRPRLSHLRESGALEQDANGVWFLHRKGDGSEDGDATTTDVELIVAAQRAGGTGTVPLTFRRSWCTFFESTSAPEPYSVGGWDGDDAGAGP